MIPLVDLLRVHRADPLGLQLQQVVDVVEIVSRLLQEQSLCFLFVAVPPLVVVITIRHIVPSLYVLDPLGSVLDDKYASVGTGSEIAIGVLESEYKDDMSIEEAKKVVADAFKSAVARDVGSGEGADLLIMTKDGIKEESLKFA